MDFHGKLKYFPWKLMENYLFSMEKDQKPFSMEIDGKYLFFHGKRSKVFFHGNGWKFYIFPWKWMEISYFSMEMDGNCFFVFNKCIIYINLPVDQILKKDTLTFSPFLLYIS